MESNKEIKKGIQKMKKTYIKPSILCVKTKCESALLFVSGGTSGKLETPDVDPEGGEEMKAKSFDIWE